MLLDPLSKAPVVITGSANFSKASTVSNDENMLVVKGDHRVADIYFTEYMRLFTHYYFRSVFETLAREGTAKQQASIAESVFLKPNDSWLKKYEPGTFRRKRVEMFINMEGIRKQ